MRKFALDPTGLGPEGFEAWIRFLRPLVTVITRNDPTCRAYAENVLGSAQQLLDLLATWSDDEAATVLDSLTERWRTMRRLGSYELSVDQVVSWVARHEGHDRAAAVAQCIAITAPAAVNIERRLATTGLQKRVFAATWSASGQRRRIVLKEFLGDAALVIPREMQAYPLSMMHPNIIQTYRLENPADPERPFLAERRIHPLDDGWRAAGLAEAAQVLTDIARALAFLADQGLVHGDLKPDNVGYDDGRYLLLDFGVARPASEFAALDAPTGTLRTRAPEVIAGRTPQTPSSDLYALGASVFNSLYGRFPLVSAADAMGMPHTNERKEFVSGLRARVEGGWSGELQLLDSCKHAGLRAILQSILTPHEADRPAADEVLRMALRALEPLIGAAEGPLFRPWDELDQMAAYLSEEEGDIRLLPRDKAVDLADRLTFLEQGLGTSSLEQLVDQLIAETARLAEEADSPTDVTFRGALRELEHQRALLAEGVYEALVSELRDRIQRRESPWPDIPPDRKRLLEAAIAHDVSPAYGARMRVLLEALERRKSLPAW